SFLAAAPQAQQKGIPIVAVGLSAPGVTDVGDYVYRIVPDVTKIYPGRDKDFLGAFKAKTVAFLSNNDSETVVSIYKARKAGFDAAGVTTVADQTMTQKDTDLRAQLTEIKNANPDIFVINAFPGQLASIYLQAEEVGIAT